MLNTIWTHLGVLPMWSSARDGFCGRAIPIPKLRFTVMSPRSLIVGTEVVPPNPRCSAPRPPPTVPHAPPSGAARPAQSHHSPSRLSGEISSASAFPSGAPHIAFGHSCLLSEWMVTAFTCSRSAPSIWLRISASKGETIRRRSDDLVAQDACRDEVHRLFPHPVRCTSSSFSRRFTSASMLPTAPRETPPPAFLTLFAATRAPRHVRSYALPPISQPHLFSRCYSTSSVLSVVSVLSPFTFHLSPLTFHLLPFTCII